MGLKYVKYTLPFKALTLVILIFFSIKNIC